VLKNALQKMTNAQLAFLLSVAIVLAIFLSASDATNEWLAKIMICIVAPASVISNLVKGIFWADKNAQSNIHFTGMWHITFAVGLTVLLTFIFSAIGVKFFVAVPGVNTRLLVSLYIACASLLSYNISYNACKRRA
jgi:hypothetical protein